MSFLDEAPGLDGYVSENEESALNASYSLAISSGSLAEVKVNK